MRVRCEVSLYTDDALEAEIADHISDKNKRSKAETLRMLLKLGYMEYKKSLPQGVMEADLPLQNTVRPQEAKESKRHSSTPSVRSTAPVTPEAPPVEVFVDLASDVDMDFLPEEGTYEVEPQVQQISVNVPKETVPVSEGEAKKEEARHQAAPESKSNKPKPDDKKPTDKPIDPLQMFMRKKPT